jgi:pyruvate kinase
MDYASDSDTFIRVADQILVEQHLATCLETIVIVAGVMKVRGATNMMKIHRVDEH